MLYLAMMDITKKWTGHRQDWGQIRSQLEIYFEERLSGGICKRFPVCIDSVRNLCIIQTGAEPENLILSFETIYISYFEFTQNLKRSQGIWF